MHSDLKVFFATLLVPMVSCFEATAHASRHLACGASYPATMMLEVAQFIQENPPQIGHKDGADLMEEQVIQTGENETMYLEFVKPFRLTFELKPNSQLIVIKNSTAECGPKMKITYGSVLSDGDHAEDHDCDYELETPEAFIDPVGTRYTADISDLNQAIADLNPDSGESFYVGQGSIRVTLKRLTKSNKKNKIRFVKTSLKGKQKRKAKVRFLAYNEKIKLRTGASLKIKRNKKSKTTQAAKIEVTEPI